MDKVIKKKDAQVREQIFHNFVNILDLFPQNTISQHLLHILRKKDDVKSPYFWSNEELLKKFEKYHDELNTELISVGEEVND